MPQPALRDGKLRTCFKFAATLRIAIFTHKIGAGLSRHRRIGFAVLLFALLAVRAGAADFFSVKSGGWIDPTTWGLLAGYPFTGDNVTITNGNNVALSFSNSLYLQINNLVLSNGTLSISATSGQGVFASAGADSMWTNATLSGFVLQLGTLNLLGNNSLLTGSGITNRGTIHQMGTGNLAPNQDIIVNSTGSTYDFAGDGTINTTYNDLATFINQGTLLKSSGVNTSGVSIWFENEGGTIEVDSGTLALPGAAGYTSTNGTFIVATNATLLASGNWTGEITGSGDGRVVLSSGSFNANPILALDFPDGLFQWIGGNMGGTVTNLGTITLSGSNTMGCPALLVNAGLFRQTNTANFRISETAFENLPGATYDLEDDGNIAAGGFGIGGYFYNRGLFRKSGGAGVSTFEGENVFDNYGGTLELDSGTLQDAYSFTQTNGVTWLNGGNLSGSTLSFNGGVLTGFGSVTGAVVNAGAVVLPGTNGLGTLDIVGNYQQQSGGVLDIALGGTNAGDFSQLDVSGGASLAGSLNLSLTNDYAPAIGDRFQILFCSSRGGAFSLPPTFPTGISVTYSNSGAYLVVTGAVVFPAQLNAPAVSGGNFDFDFPTVSGQGYTVQTNDDLTTTNWGDFTNFTGDGSLRQFVVPTATVPRRFFRVRSP